MGLKLASFNVCTPMEIQQQIGLSLHLEILDTDVYYLAEGPIQDPSNTLHICSPYIALKGLSCVRLSEDHEASSSGFC